MMKIKFEKFSFVDNILLLAIIFQFGMVINGFWGSTDKVNIYLFFNNYLIIFLIITTLFFKNGIKHFLGIAFYVCFFIFLMGQKIFKDDKNVFLTFTKTTLNTDQFFVFNIIVFLGIICSYCSYMFFSNNRHDKKNRQKYVCDIRPILPLIRFLFFATLPMALYMQLKIVIVRSSISYTSGYLMNVDVPAIIKIGYYLFTCFAMVYLATKPTKKEMYIIIAILLFVEGGMQLVQGRRAFFATTLFFIVWYLLKFYNIKKVNMAYVLGVACGGIALVVLFFFVEMKRSGISVGNVNLGYIIKNFMSSTGGSDSVIANTIVHKNDFPKSGILYLIDPVINNPITVILTGKSGIGQGMNYLQNFNSFSHWISYLTQASLYNSGHGMGSCYLAEIYLAFGNVGIIIISIIIGYVIDYMSRLHFDGSIFRNAIIFILVKDLFTLPRSGLFSWFGDFMYLLVGFCVIYPFYNIYCKKFRR